MSIFRHRGVWEWALGPTGQLGSKVDRVMSCNRRGGLVAKKYDWCDGDVTSAALADTSKHKRIRLDIGALWYLRRIFHKTCSSLIQYDDRQSTTCRGGGHREVVNNKGNSRANKTVPDRQGQRNSNSVATPQVGWRLIVKVRIRYGQRIGYGYSMVGR
jgi:hypothetical protein